MPLAFLASKNAATPDRGGYCRFPLTAWPEWLVLVVSGLVGVRSRAASAIAWSGTGAHSVGSLWLSACSRILSTMIYELRRSGGQGDALLLEV